jgi:hypothetical protein
MTREDRNPAKPQDKARIPFSRVFRLCEPFGRSHQNVNEKGGRNYPPLFVYVDSLIGAHRDRRKHGDAITRCSKPTKELGTGATKLN